MGSSLSARISVFSRMALRGLALLALHPLWPAGAQEVPSPVFSLGQITVSAPKERGASLGTTSLEGERLWDFNKEGLAEAINLVPGVASTPGAGSRNEARISVRGFSGWQVPLLMDGIRLYLPADNRIDFDRFLTPDLSEIQISKSYVSVLNGPDGMGGAINLVTRKPVRAFEGELRASIALGGGGQYNGNTLYANLGTRQEKFYLQASAERRDVDHWRLSEHFEPTAAENGGNRERSDKKDSRFNVKAGFTPNATDEYSINYVQQSGEKHGIMPVTGASPINTWDWPEWDTSSLYWLSNTRIGDKSYVKTRAYYNTFKNTLSTYTDISLTTHNFISYYDDNALGFSIEAGTDLLPQQTLKAAFHYRRDEHNEWQYFRFANAGNKTPAHFTEPKQKALEDNYSLSLEDTWHLSPALDLIAGISHDMRRSKEAQEFASPGGGKPAQLFNQPVANSHATNLQAAALWRYGKTGEAHLFVSDRTRFPTMFERFSSRFGGAISNPWLRPERALNGEVGIADQLLPGMRGEVSVFHSRVKDAIQSVPYPYPGCPTCMQSQNVGTATYRGFEFGLTAAVSATLEAGGNYSYTDTRIQNPNDASDRLTTTPRNKAFVYAKWQPLAGLILIPSLEYASSRWSFKAVGGGYVKTGQYALANLKVSYQLLRDCEVSLTARNLFDRNYQPSDGYPQEGRNFILATRLQF